MTSLTQTALPRRYGVVTPSFIAQQWFPPTPPAARRCCAPTSKAPATCSEGLPPAKMDPIIHVSSFSALFRPGLAMLHADLPVVGGSDGYGKSKAIVEAYARGLQDAGAPVNISYPGMVLGPPAGDQFGEAAEGVQAALKTAVCRPQRRRDRGGRPRLAALHVALLQPGQGRAIMAGGRLIAVGRLAFLLGAAADRNLVVYPVPDVGLRALGRWFDVIGDHLPFETPNYSAATQNYTDAARR